MKKELLYRLQCLRMKLVGWRKPEEVHLGLETIVPETRLEGFLPSRVAGEGICLILIAFGFPFAIHTIAQSDAWRDFVVFVRQIFY